MSMLCMSKNHVCLASKEKSPEDEKKPASVERPLVRTTNISTFTIKLYRLMIIVRMGILVLFFHWRISTANVMMMSSAADTDDDDDDTSRVVGAIMWTVSIAGELWFALTWVLDQLPKMQPVRRAVDVAALDEALLPAMDVFVTTTDPDKEPPLATANTVLSILAVDYPADKLTCYVSDDGGAPLTLEAIAEAAQFAKLWVPFCRKHGVEPRNPEAYYYYYSSVDGNNNKARRVVTRGEYKGRAWPEFARDRRRVRREYEELRLRINALHAGDMKRRRQQKCAMMGDDGNGWRRRRGTAEDHAGVVQVVIPSAAGSVDAAAAAARLPALVYVCREKRRGRAHHQKAGALNALLRASAVLSDAPFVLNLDCDHYVNNPRALRAGLCNMLGRGGGGVAFVQFPQRFDAVDPGDRYANHNRVFFDCTELSLDGLQGPIYVGTGCIFRRSALYGMDPPPPHAGEEEEAAAAACGGSNNPCSFDEAAIAEATALVSCGYEEEDRTAAAAWGRDMGWMYGTVTEDVATGLSMHRRGWRSAYCATAPDAFRGTAPLNLTDRLHQVLRWAAGSLEILFSRNHSPLLAAGGRLHPLQRAAYLNTTVYPFTSVFVLLYCVVFPAIPLVTGKQTTAGFVVSSSMDMADWWSTYVAFVAALMLTLAMAAVLEVRWSGITLGDWWRNQQFWMVSATSAYPAALAQVALKVAAGKELSFKLTSKQQHDASTGGGGGCWFAELYDVRWTALMVPPAMVLVVNVASMVAGIEGVHGGSMNNGAAATLRVAFNAWVLLHLYPFAQGLMGRWSKTWCPLLLIVAWITIRVLCFLPQFHSFNQSPF